MAGNANSGSKRDKLIREALTLAANRVHDGDPQGRKKLAIACEKVVEAALDGDLAAFKEMADRIDGKAVQAIEQTGEIKLTHVDAKQRLARKLHAVVEPRAETEPSIVAH